MGYVSSGEGADKGRGGKTTLENGQAWSSASPRGSGEQGRVKKTGCKNICGAPRTLEVKGLMIMMMMMMVMMMIMIAHAN